MKTGLAASHPEYLSSLIILVVVLVLFAPALLQPGGLIYPARGQFSDLTITHWPALDYLRETMRRTGTLPLWRTSILAGTPFAADPVSGVWYPPNWLALILPLEWFFKLTVVGHLWLGGWGMLRLARSFRVSWIGATAAGVAYAIAPRAIGHTGAGHITLIEALAWFPLIVWAARRDPTAGGAAVSGALLGVCMLADLRAAVYATIALAAYLLIAESGRMMTQQPPEGPDAARTAAPAFRLARLAVALAAAALVGAAAWASAAWLAGETTRVSLTSSEAAAFSLAPSSLLGVLVASRGNPENVTYVGVSVLALALVGLRRLWRIQRRAATWLMVLIALGIIVALGANTGLYEWLARLPGLSLLRVPARAWLLVAFVAPLAGGVGVDVLCQWTGSLRRPAAFVGVIIGWFALLFGIGGALAILASGQNEALNAALSLIGLAVLLPMTIALLLLRASGRLNPSRFGVLIGLLIVADLVWTGWGHYHVVTTDQVFEDGRALAEYVDARAANRIYSPSYSIPQHVAQARGLRTADGIDPLQLARTVGFMQAATGAGAWGYSVTLPAFEGLQRDEDIRTWLSEAAPEPALLGLLGVGTIVAHFPIDHPDLVEIARVDGAFVYENRRALPRAWVVGRADVVGNQEEALAWLQSHDPRIEAAVENAPAIGAGATGGPARIEVDDPDRIVVSAAGPGLLVLSEVFERDWRATLDGRPAPILVTDGVLRGVQLPEGPHRVEFVYDPTVVKVAAVISAASLVGVLVAWAIPRRRRRAG